MGSPYEQEVDDELEEEEPTIGGVNWDVYYPHSSQAKTFYATLTKLGSPEASAMRQLDNVFGRISHIENLNMRMLAAASSIVSSNQEGKSIGWDVMDMIGNSSSQIAALSRLLKGKGEEVRRRTKDDLVRYVLLLLTGSQ